MAGHRDIWPKISYSDHIHLQTITLPTLLEKENIDLRNFDALVMDTQGSELLVLKGAERILSAFRTIKTEAADFECYKGNAQLDEIAAYLSQHGFRLVRKVRFATRLNGGSCYDVLFQQSSRQSLLF